MSDKSLKNKVALITGSTSGIGLGIAHKLAEQGAHIVLNGLGDAAEIEKTRADLSAKHKVDVIYCSADVGKHDQVADMVKQAQSKFGALDILVNNAGIQFVAPVDEFPVEKWDAIISINLSSAFYAIRTAVPMMREKGWGRIINVASAHGLVASPNKSAYVAAKHGVVGLTKAVALETAGKGITSNAICPGWVLTPLVQKQIDDIAAKDNLSPEEAKKKLLGFGNPSMQFVEPEQIAAMALYLCSDAAAQVTGSALSIDGGWVAR